MKDVKNFKLIVLFTILSYMGLTINLNGGEIGGGGSWLTDYIGHFNGFSIYSLFQFAGLFFYFKGTLPQERCFCYRRTEIVLSLMLSVFVVLGKSFESTNTWNLAFGNQNGQIIKSLTMFAGLFLVFFAGITYIYSKWENRTLRNNSENEKEHSTILTRHPFIVVFFVIIILSIPNAIISYPGILMGDNPWQIVQAFPEIRYLGFPQWQQLSENVYISAHHPVAHTMLIHACLMLGHDLFNSWNLGLFIYSLVQGIGFIAAVSYAITLCMNKRLISSKYILTIAAIYYLHPHDYSGAAKPPVR